MSGKSVPLTVSESDTILDVKHKLSPELPEIGGVEMMQLVFGGRQLRVDLTVRECHLQKECTVQLLKKGRQGVAPIVVPETKEPAGSSRARHGPLLRTTLTGGEEFDGSDGWAVAEDIDVADAQDWFRKNRKDIQWDPWGPTDNKLQYFLADVPAVHYSAEVASFLNEHLGTTQRLDASRFGSVPSCILEIDAQLRRVLVDPRFDSNPLLGSAEEGAFVLGYVQCSVMPVPLLPKRSSGALGELEAATSQRTGDAMAYGDVIVTVTLFGEVEISLVKDDSKCCTCKGGPLGASATCGACRKSRIQPMERGAGKVGGSVLIAAGQAYAISGKARWKMKHDAIVPAISGAISGLDSIARVGLTFRYFRRSFLEIRRRGSAAAGAAGATGLCPLARPSLTSPSPLGWFDELPRPLELVDARFYDGRGVLMTDHYYTYPALVLRVDRAARQLTLYYLSDGLGADSDEEAFEIGKKVPAAAVWPMHRHVRFLLEHEECPWTRASFRRVKEIREAGADKFLQSPEQA